MLFGAIRRLLNKNLTTDLTGHTDFLSEISLVCEVCVVRGFIHIHSIN
jgi:hypothetical protein